MNHYHQDINTLYLCERCKIINRNKIAHRFLRRFKDIHVHIFLVIRNTHDTTICYSPPFVQEQISKILQNNINYFTISKLDICRYASVLITLNQINNFNTSNERAMLLTKTHTIISASFWLQKFINLKAMRVFDSSTNREGLLYAWCQHFDS